MKNRRVVFAAIIKLLAVSSLIVLVVVFISSLFIRDPYEVIETKNTVSTVTIDVSDMYKGQIIKTRWENKEVAVLFRQNAEQILAEKTVEAKEDLHPSIANQMRSQNKDYFVYYNWGDSRNCPLFYKSSVFKDICTSNTFDEAGRSLSESSQDSLLSIPPHYFQNNSLIIGRWSNNKVPE